MFYASTGACGGYQSNTWTAPTHCPHPPVAAGLVFYELPRPAVWWAFTCAEHAELLTAPRALLDRDHTEITRRRAQVWPERTAPLAVGQAARDLLDHARRWAAANPELTYTPPPAATATDGARRGTAAHPFAAYGRNDPPGPGGGVR